MAEERVFERWPWHEGIMCPDQCGLEVTPAAASAGSPSQGTGFVRARARGMRAWVVAMVAGTLVLAAGPVHAGELGSLRSETQESDGSGGSEGGSWSSGDSEGASDTVEALAEAMEAYTEHVVRLYTRYPYADGARGFVIIVEPDDHLGIELEDEVDPAAPDPPGQRFSGTFTLHGAALGPTVGRVGVDLELMVRRFGLALDLSPHLEYRPLDALSLGSAAFMIGWVLLPRVQLSTGIGANVMIDGRVGLGQQRVDAFGIDGTFRATILPVRPVVLRARLDVGQLGVAPAVLARVTAGVMIRRFEAFGGYEARRVGDVVLHGPTLGARVWF